jgi:hypothetical protein
MKTKNGIEWEDFTLTEENAQPFPLDALCVCEQEYSYRVRKFKRKMDHRFKMVSQATFKKFGISFPKQAKLKKWRRV